MVGLSVRTGEPRLAFGLPELWDGLDLPALVAGLFIIPEMLTPTRFADDIAERSAKRTTISEVFKGMAVTLRYRATLLRSTFYGFVVGLLPGLGASFSVWLSYGYAARTVKSEIPFGRGAIAGVIAPEAANNAKRRRDDPDPCSSGFGQFQHGDHDGGLALAACRSARVCWARTSRSPISGRNRRCRQPDRHSLFFLVGAMDRAVLRRSAQLIAPFAIVIGVTASLIHEPNLITHAELVLATAHLALKAAKWPRAPFILGFVVGDLLEASSCQTAVIWGWSALTRPMTVVLALALVAWVAYSSGASNSARRRSTIPTRAAPSFPSPFSPWRHSRSSMATRRTASRSSRSARPASSCRRSLYCGPRRPRIGGRTMARCAMAGWSAVSWWPIRSSA
jgi:hypothetical protein